MGSGMFGDEEERQRRAIDAQIYAARAQEEEDEEEGGEREGEEEGGERGGRRGRREKERRPKAGEREKTRGRAREKPPLFPALSAFSLLAFSRPLSPAFS